MAGEAKPPLTASARIPRDAVRLFVGAAIVGACAPYPVVPPPPPPPHRLDAPALAPPREVAELSQSPDPDVRGLLDARERSLTEHCGRPDAGLARVARTLAKRKSTGLAVPEAEEVASMARAAGVPHPSPRVLSASTDAAVPASVLIPRLTSFGRARATDPDHCAVAVVTRPDGGEVAVAVAVRPLADLEPLPRRARPGQWLRFAARAREPLRAGELVILGPSGRPRTVAARIQPDGLGAEATFALDAPGSFVVQFVGETPSGPRPLLEIAIDTAPQTGSSGAMVAPGEDDGGDLRRMVQKLRVASELPTFEADAHLDALAAAHAERMRQTRTVAHDLGDGDLRERFRPERRDARALGENVAHAASLRAAHRALYASASHRLNLLDARYTHLGVGVAQDDDGSVWVCEIFARY